MEYYLAIEKDEILPFATTWMELKDGTYAKLNQSVRERQIYDFTHMRTLRYKTVEHTGRIAKTV